MEASEFPTTVIAEKTLLAKTRLKSKIISFIYYLVMTYSITLIQSILIKNIKVLKKLYIYFY